MMNVKTHTSAIGSPYTFVYPSLSHAAQTLHKSIRLESVLTEAVNPDTKIDALLLWAAATSAARVDPFLTIAARAIRHHLKAEWALLTETVRTDCEAALALYTASYFASGVFPDPLAMIAASPVSEQELCKATP